MSRAYVGNRVQNVDIGEELDKVTRVVLVVDSDHVYTAGDDTGRTIEREIPWGSQEMADSLLRKLSGVVYKPFNAEKAMISPAFEIGDPVTVGGVYSRIIGADINYGISGLVDLYAPDLDVTEDEYPSEKTQQSSIERQLASTRSLISKTSEEIRLEVFGEDGYTGASVHSLISTAIKNIKLEVYSEEGSTTLTLTDKDATLSTQTLNLTVNAVNISGKLKANQIDASELKVDAANVIGQLVIGNLPDGVAMTDDIPTDADITLITNNAIRTANISANQVTAGTFNGINNVLQLKGLLNLIDPNGVIYGKIGSGNGTSDGELTYGAALYNTAGSGGFFVSGSGARLFYGANGIYCASAGCYSTSEMKVSSDKRMKNSISYDLSKEEAMFATLKPCSFAYNSDANSKRRWGFVAQEMVESADKAEIDVESLDVVSKDGNGMYAVAYGEIVALNTHMIQKLMARVAELERKME